MYLAKSFTEQISMQKGKFEIKNNDFKRFVMEPVLSFRPFVDYLKVMLEDEPTVKSEFYRFVVSKFENELTKSTPISLQNSYRYKELMDLVYMILTPLATGEKDHFWALSSPLPDKIFYSTDRFHRFLTHSAEVPEMVNEQPVESYKAQQIRFAYKLILQKLYDIPSHEKNEILYQYTEIKTRLPKYYSVSTDTRFVAVKPKGILPVIDYKTIEQHLSEDSSLAALENILPLDRFIFEGFSVISVQDVTASQAIENIRLAILNHDYELDNNASVIKALKMLVSSNDIDFGLIPSIQLNGRHILARSECSQSLVIESAKELGMSADKLDSLINHYFTNPEPLVLNEIEKLSAEGEPLIELLQNKGVHSYALIPAPYNKKIAGTLEVFSTGEQAMSDAVFSRLQSVIPLIAQLLQYSAEEFSSKIESVIRDKFTPLQPSVQWKFDEAALRYLEKNQRGRENKEIETVTFEKVYPLYGAVDIRNSTIERNKALKEDVTHHLDLLSSTLRSLKDHIQCNDVAHIDCASNRWVAEINEYVSTADETALNRFLEATVHPFLSRIKEGYPAAASIVDQYFQELDETNGSVFENRRKLEVSLQLVNSAVAGYIENAQTNLKTAYPFYFEKFRTDGIEYDMYVGQSLAPEKPFDKVYLNHLRLWQLTSMAEITRLTKKLLPQMEKPLHTTQLIFIHSNPININFRNDERRFDVEGAYNIRYEIIKKRIDKALIRETQERLTQPGKIAMVYFDDKEAAEYMEYIDDLKEKGLLEDDLEHLELEELQGVVGLKAMRIGVRNN